MGPGANALLLSVTAPAAAQSGLGAYRGTTAAASGALWASERGVGVVVPSPKQMSDTAAGRANIYTLRQVVIPAGLCEPTEGCTLRVRWQGAEHLWKVDRVEDRRGSGSPWPNYRLTIAPR